MCQTTVCKYTNSGRYKVVSKHFSVLYLTSTHFSDKTQKKISSCETWRAASSNLHKLVAWCNATSEVTLKRIDNKSFSLQRDFLSTRQLYNVIRGWLFWEYYPGIVLALIIYWHWQLLATIFNACILRGNQTILPVMLIKSPFATLYK